MNHLWKQVMASYLQIGDWRRRQLRTRRIRQYPGIRNGVSCCQHSRFHSVVRHDRSDGDSCYPGAKNSRTFRAAGLRSYRIRRQQRGRTVYRSSTYNRVQPLYEAGRASAMSLVDVIEGRKPENILLNTSLTIRESCGCLSSRLKH